MATKVTPIEGRWQRTPIRGERAYIPSTVEDLEPVRVAMVKAGYSASVINGLTGWLVAKALGEADTTDGRTRARYRKILADLDVGDVVRSLAA